MSRQYFVVCIVACVALIASAAATLAPAAAQAPGVTITFELVTPDRDDPGVRDSGHV